MGCFNRPTMTLDSPSKLAPLSRVSAHDAIGIVCCGELAFVFSSVAHEAIGHGAVAWLTGAKITRLRSVLFNADHAGAIVDAGGPLMNFLLAGGAAFFVPQSTHGCLRTAPRHHFSRGQSVLGIRLFYLFWDNSKR